MGSPQRERYGKMASSSSFVKYITPGSLPGPGRLYILVIYSVYICIKWHHCSAAVLSGQTDQRRQGMIINLGGRFGRVLSKVASILGAAISSHLSSNILVFDSSLEQFAAISLRKPR